MLPLLINLVFTPIAMILFHVHWVFSSWQGLMIFGGISLLLGLFTFVLLWVVMLTLSPVFHRRPVDNPTGWVDLNDPAHPIIGAYLLASEAIFVWLSTVTRHWRW